MSRKDVMSSIRRNLELNPNLHPTKDKRVEGASELLVTVRNNFSKQLTNKMLFNWHSLLMRKGNTQIQAGQWHWHEEVMQIVSGAIGREKVHFEAPPSKKAAFEMSAFIT